MEKKYDFLVGRLIDDDDEYLKYEYNYKEPYYNSASRKVIIMSKQFIYDSSLRDYDMFSSYLYDAISDNTIWIDQSKTDIDELPIIIDFVWALVCGYKEYLVFAKELTIYSSDSECDEYEDVDDEYDEILEELLTIPTIIN